MKKLFVFGSTGDLVKRKVLPALIQFKDIKAIALGRKDLTKELYLKKSCNSCDLNLDYKKIEFKKNKVSCKTCKESFDKDKTNYFYISLPPEQILSALNYLKEINKNFQIQILIEKPLGNSLREAKKIKRFLDKNELTEKTFLSDHYLFKENFLKIKKSTYKKIKIVSLETLGIEGRSYYDKVGAIKDMIQGHFLNMVLKIIQKEKLKKLKISSIKTSQYKGYQKEIGKISNTETYAKIILKNKNLEIEFETGKKTKSKEAYIEVDNKRISLIDKSNPYKTIFKEFLENKRENFPSIEDSISAWRITEKILKKR